MLALLKSPTAANVSLNHLTWHTLETTTTAMTLELKSRFDCLSTVNKKLMSLSFGNFIISWIAGWQQDFSQAVFKKLLKFASLEMTPQQLNTIKLAFIKVVYLSALAFLNDN